MANILAWIKTPVRSYVGWYRHITLVMLALAFLTSIALQAHSPSPEESQPPPDVVMQTSVCPLSVPEARHLLARLLFPPASSPPLVKALVGVEAQASTRGSHLPYPPPSASAG